MMSNDPDYNALHAHAIAFCTLLTEHGFSAQLREDTFRGYQCKITLIHTAKHVGNLVIHHKPSKQTFTLSLNEIKDQAPADAVRQLHHMLLARERASLPTDTSHSHDPSLFSAVEYYYAILTPYAAEPFDFITYASALLEAATRLGVDSSNIIDARFDFALLSAMYHELLLIAQQEG